MEMLQKKHTSFTAWYIFTHTNTQSCKLHRNKPSGSASVGWKFLIRVAWSGVEWSGDSMGSDIAKIEYEKCVQCVSWLPVQRECVASQEPRHTTCISVQTVSCGGPADCTHSHLIPQTEEMPFLKPHSFFLFILYACTAMIHTARETNFVQSPFTIIYICTQSVSMLDLLR